ncbi:transcription factor Sox-2-like [Thalassophryne amazonica]|uniref:transcription factor Sox-2-like n=1 Tax=Thalassophryne amazonica TaxID=390379 RepID=UPI00147113AE|nr:transcription factor Sox-2-like [Thalassophryne amazonica]
MRNQEEEQMAECDVTDSIITDVLEYLDQELDTVGDVEASEDERELMEPWEASRSEQRPQTISWNPTQDRQTKVNPDMKKPPNAFILFNMEQRPLICKELKVKDSATISRMLSEKWKALSKKEKSKYTEKAAELRKRHLEKFPNWSAKDNYGKKMKRVMATPTNWMEGKMMLLSTRKYFYLKCNIISLFPILCVVPHSNTIFECVGSQNTRLRPRSLV